MRFTYFAGIELEHIMRHVRAAFALLLACTFSLLGGNASAQLVANAGNDATICAGGPITLGGNPAGSGGQGPYQYSWSPATGLNNANIQHPVCTTTGTQVYTLTVTDALGDDATDAVTVTVNSTPDPSLSVPNDPLVSTSVFNGTTTFSLCNQGAANHLFDFTDNSTADANASFTLNWGTGGGNFTPPAAGWSQSHTYPIGLTTLTYTITNPNGCTVTEEFYVFIGSNPSVGINNPGNTSVCTGQPVCFPITFTSNNTVGTQYLVDFGDGTDTSFVQPAPTEICHLYVQNSCAISPPYYTVRIDATNPCLAFPSFGTAGPILVSDAPQAAFTPSVDTSCAGSTVSFTNTSTSSEAPLCASPRTVWSVSPATGWTALSALGSTNGNASSSGWTAGAFDANIRFDLPGTYCVKLKVGNAICGVDSVVHCVCVEAPPLPAFTLSPTTGCSPLVSTTDNTSASPNSCSTRYNWLTTVNSAACGGSATANFSGGTNASSFEPQFTFTGAGSYTVTLQAINSCGTFPVNVPVTVGAPPQVAVNPVSGICEGQSASPSAVFTPCGSPITDYAWTMPGGAPASAGTQSPGSITYPTSGNFTITASATSGCGTTTSSTPLSVTPLPAAPVVGGPITLCVGETLDLGATPVAGTTFHWTGPNGFDSYLTNPSIPNITLAGQGVYIVTASGGGCSGPPSTVTVTVNPAPVVSISPIVPSVCAGNAVTLTASGGSNYQWTAGGVNIGSGTPFTFTPSTTTTVVLLGDAGGCTGSSSTLVTVHPLPVVNAGPDRVFCESNQAQTLSPITAGGLWSGDPNVTANGQFTPAVQGSHQLIYTVVSPQGCANTDTIQVTVAPPATPADAGPDTLVCQNAAPVQLTGTPAGGTWTGAISNSGLFTPAGTGTFVVHYTAGAGSCSSADSATVTVVPATAVDPGPDQQLCIDQPAFALGATPAGGTWSGDGIVSSDFDPGVAGAGSHALTYTYNDPNGCITTAVRTITVHPLPVVSAGNDTTFCDQPFAQTLTGYSPVGGTWTGTGVTPGGSFTPNGPGTFQLTYSYTDANLCSASDSIIVTVITISNPAIAGNDTAVCVNGGTLQLSGGPAGGTWSGPHVDAAGAFDPIVAGNFTLTYAVGAGSCVTQDQVEVTVHPLPVIDITSAVDVCVDAGVQTLAATPLGGTWSGTGITDAALGSFDPAVSGDGVFSVHYAFTDGNGCSNIDSVDVTVNPLPTAEFSNDPTACSNVPVSFTDGSTGASAWTWDFGDGDSSFVQDPSHVFAMADTFTVTLTAISAEGCTHSIAHDVIVWAGPEIGFDVSPVEGCAPLVVTLDNQSTGEGVSYAWDFGDGTASIVEDPDPLTYHASVIGDTTYTITLTATNFCGSVDSVRTITVHPEPTALFGPDFDSGCSPWPVTFSNVTIGQADSYLWDFGDGLTSTTTDSLVQHTYYTGAEDTTYTITLVAANACGSDTATYTITVQPNSITAFFNTDTTSGCTPLTVNFTQYSIGATNWHWDLGEGNVSTAQNATATYDTAGVYTVTLFADNGCSYDTVSVQITVQASPPADFDIQPGPHCAGTPVQFTNNTPSPAGLTWDFGDGGSSTLSAPTHSYAAAGSYNVSLSVASALNECPAILTQTVNIMATPGATFSAGPFSGCIPLNVQFTNSSADADFYQWDFDDGNTIGASDPMHTFVAEGTYHVRLVAENLNGCTDTAFATVVAFPLPVSAFTMASDQSCDSPFDLQLSNASTGAVSHAWDFGNGTSSLLNDPVATFDSPGTYTITLTVLNQYGCTDISTDEFTVHPTPVAQFVPEPQPACAGYPVTFGNTSINSMGYQWAFGDGEGSTEESPWHIYPEGDYTVTLIATGAGGCTDTLVVPHGVQVNPRPTAAFSYVPMQSTTYALQFHNASTGATSWIWDFGDGEHSTEYAPLHLFPAGPNNLYPFCLVAINTFGCPDTLCQPVFAESDPAIYAPNAFTPDQDGVNENFLPILNGFEDWRYHFYVFDRWGEVIHNCTDRNTPWDGTYSGKPVKTDVYVWKVVLNRDGDERVYYGHVTVVRGTE